jgi:membrane protease YdiL (CAAX protease family)
MTSFAEPSPHDPSLLDRMRHWAVLRIAVQAVCLVLVIIAVQMTFALAGIVPPVPSPLHAPLAIVRDLLIATLLLTTYGLLIRHMEQRPAVEVALRPGITQFPAGLAIGVGMMTMVYLVLYAGKMASFGPGNGWHGLALGFIAAVLAGVFEELLLRAVLFRILEDAFGTTIALVASAAVFGLLHHFNSGATAFSDLAIALEAGLMLALAYAVTRNLWLAIGIHAGWNFTEGNIFGAQVSGSPISPSLIHSVLAGPRKLTGGLFGPEASVVSIGVSAMVSAVFVLLILRQGGWRPFRFRLAVD